MRPLNYVCAFFQPIVPLVYDNTLTLVECVNKLRYKVNEMIAAYNKVLPELQNIDTTTKAAEEAAAYVAEYAKLPHILNRKTYGTASSDVAEGTQVNTLYSDYVQDICGAFTISKDVTSGTEFVIQLPVLINQLTNGNTGFTAKLAESFFYEDDKSSYGGSYIEGLTASCAAVSILSGGDTGYPKIKLTFSAAVDHIEGKLYVHSIMKAGS